MPDPACAMSYITDGKNFLGDENREQELVRKVSEAIFRFYWMDYPNGKGDIQSHRVLDIQTLRNENVAKSCTTTRVVPIILILKIFHYIARCNKMSDMIRCDGSGVVITLCTIVREAM